MFALPPDPYKALGVSKDAQIPDIRIAYKKLILKCHPDKVQDPELKAEKQAEFQRVQEAYELLNDDIERMKYDEKARYNEKYGELEKEREKTKMSSSPPSGARTPSRSRTSYFEPEIRTAEPRPSTFAKTGTSPSARSGGFYNGGFASSRSFEDGVGASPRSYDEARRSKKSSSYERERDREWDREREHDREREKLERRRRKEKEAAEEVARERERERIKQEAKAAAKETEESKKKKERKDKDKDKKKAEKERKREAEDKHRRHKPYAEPYHEDSEVEEATPHVFEKKASNRTLDEALHESPPRPATKTSEWERKYSANVEQAIRYLERSGSNTKPPLSRSPTYDAQAYNVRHVIPPPPAAAPTPPPAIPAAHPPPPTRDTDVEEDGARRSSARSSRAKPPDALRSSARESRDKSSHRKSGTRSASREAARPNIVDAAPGVTRVPPPLQKSYTDPHRVVQLNRSYTTENYSRPSPHPVPGLERTHTWQQGDDHDRGRGRRGASFSEEDDGDGHYHRHSRRTLSPEPMPTTHRYSVADGKTRRKYSAEAMPIPTRSHKVKHVMANTSSPRADPGLAAYYAKEFEAEPSHAPFQDIKFAPTVHETEVQYSNLPRYSSSYTKEPYTTQAY